jgi:hypothetical protein
MWSNRITADILDTILKKDVVATYTKAFGQLRELNNSQPRSDTDGRISSSGGSDAEVAAFEQYLNYESQVAGTLLLLVKQRQFDALEDLFYVSKDSTERAAVLRLQDSSPDRPQWLDRLAVLAEI